jgi:hypothetical protein
MAVADRETELVEKDAEDTLRRNRAALAESRQRVGELRESRKSSRRRIVAVTRRLKAAGVSLDDPE